MNMKKLFLMIVAIVAFAATADAQGFLKKLKDKAVERVQNKIENKVERTVDDEMDGVLDGKAKEQNARPQHETVYDAELTSDGGLIIAGSFAGTTIDLGDGIVLEHSDSSNYGVIVKYSNIGTTQWAKEIRRNRKN